MDEMREALLKLAYNIRKMTGGLMMEGTRLICLRDILDLLSPRGVKVEIRRGRDIVSGNGDARLWEYIEDELVEAICPSSDGLTVWLEKEADDDET